MVEKLVLIAAGGTGGHMFPAAAFALAMRARGWRSVLMTDARGRRYAENFPADAVEDVPAATIAGANPIKAGLAAVKILSGVSAAQRRFSILKPALAAGFGGYPSLPALWAAKSRKVPILIHEQNAVLGRVNRMFAGAAGAVACGFERLDKLPASAAGKKAFTGNPVRPAILEAARGPFPPLTPGGGISLLITGGSQGARLFGEVAPAAIAQLPSDLRSLIEITQQVREEQLAAVRAAYDASGTKAHLSPFFNDMADRLASCHLMIGRAGASTVTEIAVMGRPSILIPLAIAADDHQSANADALASVGAADILPEKDFTPQRLAAVLAERLKDPHGLMVRGGAARHASKPDAAERLADLAETLALTPDLPVERKMA